MEWYIYAGISAGLSYSDIMVMPYGELLDYIAIRNIMKGAAKQAKTQEDEEDDFWGLMGRR